MGFQICMTANARQIKAVVSAPIRSFYGVALASAAKTPALITGLANRGPTPGVIEAIFTLTSTGNNAYYFAYPKSYGQAKFIETANLAGDIIGLGYGGWDGAKGYPISLFGPVIVPNVVADGQPAQDFYLYQSDWEGLGETFWHVTKV